MGEQATMAALWNLRMAPIDEKSHPVVGSAMHEHVGVRNNIKNTYIWRERRSKTGRHNQLIVTTEVDQCKGLVLPLWGI